MRVVLDACVWGGASAIVRGGGHSVVSISDSGPDPGDAAVLELAHRLQAVLVTLDRDFGELAVVRGMPHSGILRLVSVRARDQGSATLEALARYGPELERGAIVTIEPGRTRIRAPGPPPPLPPATSGH